MPLFEGPLDLLLHLIERDELDITTISLAQVTDQYLGYMRQLEETQVANLVDFLVVASKLLLIKSRLLLPAPPSIIEDKEEDIGEDLVRQLIEYRKFKKIASLLSDRGKENLHAYVRVGATTITGSQKTLDMSDVSLDALVRAVRHALEITPPEPPVSQVIPPITVSIHDKIEEIKTNIRRNHEISFDELVANSRGKVEIIVTFLAMLELIKGSVLSVHQEGLFGRIVLRHRPEGQKIAEETVDLGADTEE